VVGGLIVLVVVLAAASAAGLVLRRRQGRFTPAKSTPLQQTGPADPVPATSPAGLLTPQDLGAPLGPRVTLVQFSTEVCAYCGPVRQLLAEVAAARDGVTFVEIDAADRMDLTRRLHVMSTPTVLVLDATGGITSRASGPVRRAELLSAVGAALGHSGDDMVAAGE
jgi:thiol-disulfide isomerase/thioredoxin